MSKTQRKTRTVEQKKLIADKISPIVKSLIDMPAVNKDIRLVITKYMGKNYSYNSKAWNSLMPVYNKCLQSIIKRSIKEESSALQGIKKLAPINSLRDYLIAAAGQNTPQILAFGIYQTIKWLNEKTK